MGGGTMPDVERTEETIAERFPDRGERPSNEIVVDPDAAEVPNTEHPR